MDLPNMSSQGHGPPSIGLLAYNSVLGSQLRTAFSLAPLVNRPMIL
jgi:hypothetical protein